MFSHDKAPATSPIVPSWILFAQNAAPGAHTYTFEEGPELPMSSGPGASEGGEVPEGIHAQGCTTIEESRIRGQSGRAGGQVSASGVCRHCFEGPGRLHQRDYYTSANHEDLQGVKDPRRPVGMTATRKRGPRCSRPPLGGLTK
jgi:hypothetical protein